MNSNLFNKLALIATVLILSLAQIAYAEDLTAEPGVVDLGEPQHQPETEAAQEIHAAIAKTQHDIAALHANTENEINELHQEISLLKTTEGNAAKIRELQQKIKDLKKKTAKEIKAMQKQIKKLEHEARHKFHVRHEKY